MLFSSALLLSLTQAQTSDATVADFPLPAILDAAVEACDLIYSESDLTSAGWFLLAAEPETWLEKELADPIGVIGEPQLAYGKRIEGEAVVLIDSTFAGKEVDLHVCSVRVPIAKISPASDGYYYVLEWAKRAATSGFILGDPKLEEGLMDFGWRRNWRPGFGNSDETLIGYMPPTNGENQIGLTYQSTRVEPRN